MDEDFITNGPLHRQYRILQARLQEAFPSNRFSYQAIPADLTPAVWADLSRRLPWIGIVWQGIRPNLDSGRVYDGRSLWRIFLVAGNSAGIEARFLGDGKGAGLFGMAQTAVLFLHGYTPKAPADSKLAEGTIRAEGLNNSWGDGWISANTACATLDISMPIEVGNTYRAEDFLRVGAEWPAASPSSEPTLSDTYDVRPTP